ncbi:unnamed protein product [Cunninghamella blakesleeana]
MAFENFDATCFDNVKHTFPELGGVVTVENCIFYLSMLEQFVCLREQFHDYIDAFHARAELRYSLWVEGCKHRSDLDDLNSVIIPPIDVAYISHVHLLSPYRYTEDCQRMMPHMLSFNMPLKQLHYQRYLPDQQSISFWNEYCNIHGDDPFTLTINDLKREVPGYHRCPFCNQCFKILGSDYGKWRTSYYVYLKCWSCNNDFNIHDAAVDQICIDLKREKQPKENDIPWIRGTLLNDIGELKSTVMESNNYSFKDRLKRIINYNSKPLEYNQALFTFFEVSVKGKTKSMHEIESKLVKQLHYRALEQGYTTDAEVQKRKKLIDLAHCINLTYSNNPSPFSLDLIAALERQHNILNLRCMDQHWVLPDSIVRGIRHYKNFLIYIRQDGDNFDGVNSIEVDVAWYTHLMFSQNYRELTLKHVGRVINNEDTVRNYPSEESLNENNKSHRPSITSIASSFSSSSSYSTSPISPISNRLSFIGSHNNNNNNNNNNINFSTFFRLTRPKFEDDYRHGSIIVDDPIDTLSIISNDQHDFQSTQYNYHRPSHDDIDQVMTDGEFPKLTISK